MFGIGGFELFIILIFGFLIFGPDKLPDIAKTVGKGIARFREAQQDMNETLGAEKIFDPNNPDEPFKDPIEALDKIAQRQEERRKAKESGKDAPGAAGSNKEAAGEKAGAADAPAQESFTERKARYERERAARKAAEAEAAAGVAASASDNAGEKSDALRAAGESALSGAGELELSPTESNGTPSQVETAADDAPISENAGDAGDSPVGAHSVRPAAEGGEDAAPAKADPATANDASVPAEGGEE